MKVKAKIIIKKMAGGYVVTHKGGSDSEASCILTTFNELNDWLKERLL